MIRLLLVGAVLLVGSIGAFFLYIPFLPVASVVVILLGLALTFLIGARVGGTRVLRSRLVELRARRLRRRRNSPRDVKAPPALAAPSHE
jgi:hypothetical protein